MKYFIWLLRIIVGVLFIFSGLIKANDPSGLSYKMNEFFEVMHLTQLIPYSLAFSVVIIAAEIILGVTLLLGYAFRLTSILLLLLILLFTYLTAFALFSGKIKECGCFGDCIKLTPIQTFWKDVILLVMIVFLLIFRKYVQPILPKAATVGAVVLTCIFSFGMQWYVLANLPFVDCLPYKVGNNLWEKMQAPPGSTPSIYENVLVYKKDGQLKEFTQEQYASDESIWGDTTMEFVEMRSKLIQQGNDIPEIKDFALSDYNGTTVTESVLKAPGYVFLLYVRDPKTASTKNLSKLVALFNMGESKDFPAYLLFSSSQESAAAFQNANNMAKFQALVVDGTASKTAMRANPGLIVLKDGVVVGKYSSNNFPESLTEIP